MKEIEELHWWLIQGCIIYTGDSKVIKLNEDLIFEVDVDVVISIQAIH